MKDEGWVGGWLRSLSAMVRVTHNFNASGSSRGTYVAKTVFYFLLLLIEFFNFLLLLLKGHVS